MPLFVALQTILVPTPTQVVLMPKPWPISFGALT